MREFKFRAWGIEENKMFCDDEDIWFINFYDKLVNIENDEYSFMGSYAVEDEDLVLMQYTGIKDVHGKEIYEGDIVIDLATEKKYEVFYDEYKFELKDYYNPSTEYGNIAFSEGVFAVIGNIYENKDLLE